MRSSSGHREMKKILVYCQHVLGIGHLARMAEILRHLQQSNVTLVLGGPQAEIAFPNNIAVVQLPALQMDADFSALQPVVEGDSLEEVKRRRKEQLLAHVDRLQPDLLLIELFPFGRCGFRFELDPLLTHVREQYGQCRVVCSVRDILVERENPAKFEQRAVDRLNAFFDLLLIHGDPNIITLDQTFSRMRDIKIPVRYTGYIAEQSGPEAGRRLYESLELATGEQLIVVSAGSGSVGFQLLESALAAHKILAQRQPVRLQLFTGPYLAADRFDLLVEQAGQGAAVARFSDHFCDWLGAADLSISMGGYNTTMNIIPHVPLQLLEQGDLAPVRFVEKIEKMLQHDAFRPKISLNGAEETARLLLSEQLAERENER